MIEFKKFLVPVDGSNFSMRAAQYSVELIRRIGGDILLLHSHRSFSTIPGEPYFQMAIDKILEESHQLLEPYRALFTQKGIKFEELILEGAPGCFLSNPTPNN